MMHWEPSKLTSSPYALLLLNQPIKVPNFQALWNQAAFRVCVDGGTNQLYQISTSLDAAEVKPPDLITGDFDSIESMPKEHYAQLGAKLVPTMDQDNTDFTKALMELRRGQESGEYPKVKFVVVVAEGSGRYDQFFSNINTLVKAVQELALEVFLLCEESLSWILKAGSSHKIVFDQEYVDTAPHCGLIPIIGKTVIDSKGLKWNLDKTTECFFGGMVSTSNEIAENVVEIVANQDILWTMKSTRI